MGGCFTSKDEDETNDDGSVRIIHGVIIIRKV